ncbi:MAG: DUF2130 domain-containing protein [Brumimicrobium sp.]
MKNVRKQLICPNCKSDLDVDELLISQFEDSIRKDLRGELKRREGELKDQKLEYQALNNKLSKEREDIDALVREQVKTKIQDREAQLRISIEKQIEEEKKVQLQELENELIKKSSQLRELNQTKAKLLRLQREFEEKEAKIYLEKEKELDKRLENAKLSMKEELQMESFLKVKEKEDVIESLKKKLDEARSRANESSGRMKGEAQELILEEMLQETHPSDQIEEIKKGARGADCLQIVNLNNGVKAGSILYESKHTKNWSDSFIKKLKQDNLQTKADLMVVVTKTMPKDSKGKYILRDGVWVTSLENVKDLSLLLRFGLLKTHSVMITQKGKDDKMELLYNYLTSDEFKGTFESILDGFKSLQDSHHDEQRKMQLLWKKREKHLEQVLSSTVEFYGSIKGISGDSIPGIKMLEISEAS